MRQRQPAPIRVVVVSDRGGDTITDCLDGIAAQGPDRVDVVVVDLDSPDRGADIAIRHPLPVRVVVVPPGSLDRILEVGCADAPSDDVVLIGADRRPSPGWLDAALDGLDRHDLVRPAGAAAPHHLAMSRHRLRHLSLDGCRPEELETRVLAAGMSVGVAGGMDHAAARWVEPASALPAARAGSPDAPRHAGLVSIVVCTRDRPDHLERCLCSLDRLHDDHHEVIVVDNNDAPTSDLRPPHRGRVVHEPRRGLDHARNRGLHEAAGDVVAYVDDDCEVDPHWLDALRAGLADPEVHAVTGRVRPAALSTPSQRWFEAHFSFDRGVHPQRFTPWDRRPWYPMWSGGVGAGCNMAFRRDQLASIGGFDELLDMGTTIGGGGDLDIFTRLLDHGSLIAYRPDAIVWHHHRITAAGVRRQFFGYGLAVGALLTKSVLDRPGHRVGAVRFAVDRLRISVRLVRQSRARAYVVPVRLILADVVGQLLGPFVYLAARSRAARTTG